MSQTISEQQLKQLVEASLFIASKPLTIKKLKESTLSLFDVSSQQLKMILTALQQDYADRGINLVETASGFRFQSNPALAQWLQLLQQDRPAKYSRAMLETLALIAYRQPITRGEIEQVRGVAVSPTIIKTLLEREWISVVGRKDVPGQPALYATTARFLDDLGIVELTQLPALPEIESLDFHVDSQANINKTDVTQATLADVNVAEDISVTELTNRSE